MEDELAEAYYKKICAHFVNLGQVECYYYNIILRKDEIISALKDLIKSGNERFLTDSFLYATVWDSHLFHYSEYCDYFINILKGMKSKEDSYEIISSLQFFARQVVYSYRTYSYEHILKNMLNDTELAIFESTKKLIKTNYYYFAGLTADEINCLDNIFSYLLAVAIYRQDPTIVTTQLPVLLKNPKYMLTNLVLNNFIKYNYVGGKVSSIDVTPNPALVPYLLNYKPNSKASIL